MSSLLLFACELSGVLAAGLTFVGLPGYRQVQVISSIAGTLA